MVVRWLKRVFGMNVCRNPVRRSPYRPQLMAFEDRILPANLTWVGQAGGTWSVATNWSPAQVPASGDTVTFDGRAGIGANTNSTMNLGGGGLYRIGKLNLTNGYTATITLNSHLYTDVLNIQSAGTITGPSKLAIYQRIGDPTVADATIFETSYWISGTIGTTELWIGGQDNHRATLQLGGTTGPGVPTTSTLQADLQIGDAFSTVNWQVGIVVVAAGKTVTNRGTFLADSAGNTMGNTGGAMSRWNFINHGRLTMGAGRFRNENLQQPAGGGGRIFRTASLTPGENSFEIEGLVSLEETDGGLTVESGTLLISGTLTQSAGDVTVSEGTTLDVTEDYTQSGGTVADNGSLTVNGQYLVNGGTVSVGGGTIEAAASMQLAAGAFFSGSGTILANVTNAGDFDTGPALNPGSITVTGNYTQTAGTTTVTGGLTVSGTVQLAAGSFLVSGPWTPPFAVGAFAQTGGTFSLLAGALNVSGDYTQSGGAASIESSAGSVGGQLLLSGGTLSLGNVYDLTVTGGVQIDEGATLELVEGRMVGNVTNEGTLSLGSRTTPAAGNSYTIVGNYTQTATGLLIVDAGPWDVDHLSITGVATLAGTFQLVLVDEYEPALGTALAVLDYGARSGLFTSYGLPGLPAGVWDPRYDDPAFPNSLSLWVIE